MHAPETVSIGAQRITQYESIAPVILGAGHAVAVAEAIELFRIDGVDVEAPLDQGLDHCAARNLDRDGDRSRIVSGQLIEPLRKRRDCIPGVRKRLFADNSPRRIEHADLVGFACPVNPDTEPVLIVHRSTSVLPRPPLMPHRPCTGAHGATPHWTCINDRPRRGAGPLAATPSAGGRRRSRQSGRVVTAAAYLPRG